MTQQIDAQGQSDPSPFGNFGFWAIVLGGLAMLLVFIQIAGPSFEAKPSVGQQIGEIAGEMKRSAWRTFLGLPKPAPEAPPSPPFWTYLAIVAPVLGVTAIVLSVISAFRREHWRFATYGAGLGIGAIVFQFLWWVAILIAAVVVLVAIIENIGDIFSF